MPLQRILEKYEALVVYFEKEIKEDPTVSYQTIDLIGRSDNQNLPQIHVLQFTLLL